MSARVIPVSYTVEPGPRGVDVTVRDRRDHEGWGWCDEVRVLDGVRPDELVALEAVLRKHGYVEASA